jgi:NAD(P)H-dependent FMN reductase
MNFAKADPPSRFLFLLGSSRRDGNSEALARHTAGQLCETAEQRWLSLLEFDLPPFEDVRHAGDGAYPAPQGPGEVLLDATLWATDLVMVVPLYWYSLPARAKNYLDHWSGWMRVPGLRFLDRMAGKTMWAVSAVSDEDYSAANPLLGTLQLTARYTRMNWGGSLLGFGNRPGEILNDTNALEDAKSFFESTRGGTECRVH